MIPVSCRVKHDPENGTYGDCLRAVVASILEIEPPENVPHFFHDNPGGDEGHERLREYLKTQGLVPFMTYFSGDDSLENILQTQQSINPDVHFALFCQSETADHVVVCGNGKVVHNPSWVQGSVTGPNSNGYWGVMVFAKC